MKKIIALSCSASIALSAFATPAFAVYTGITVAGGNAQEISSMTISLDGGGTYTAQKTNNGFGVDLPDMAYSTTHGTATITTADGKTRTVPVSGLSDGTLGVDVSDKSCFSTQCSLGINYAHYTDNAGSPAANLYGLSLGLYKPLTGTKFSLDGSFAYNHIVQGGAGANQWQLGGSLEYRDRNFSFGPQFGYQNFSSNGFSTRTINYGAYAQWFATRQFTLGVQAGGFNLKSDFSFSNANGYYLDLDAKAYVTDDFSLSASFNHSRYNYKFGAVNENDFGVGVHWLPSETLPVAINAAYTRAAFSPGSFRGNVFYVGLQVFCNDDGATSLVDRDRTGSTNLKPYQSSVGLTF